MRALLGAVSLLTALGLVGVLMARQSKTVSLTPLPGVSPSSSSSASAPAANAREQSQQLQQRVKDEVARALEQGAASRSEAADR